MTAPTETPTAAPHQHIVDALRALHHAREAAAVTDEHVTSARHVWEAEMADIISEQRTRRAALDTAEELVRSLALAHHQVTGELKPVLGVEVVMRTKVEITDEVATREWAQRSGTGLVLDRGAITKAAAAMPIPGVTVSQVPSTRVATDLGKALAAPEVVSPIDPAATDGGAS